MACHLKGLMPPIDYQSSKVVPIALIFIRHEEIIQFSCSESVSVHAQRAIYRKNSCRSPALCCGAREENGRGFPDFFASEYSSSSATSIISTFRLSFESPSALHVTASTISEERSYGFLNHLHRDLEKDKQSG